MYESFFGLRDKPFNVTPDPRYLYLSDSHEEALSALLYGIRERKGLVTLTGPVGVGKTTVLFSFFNRIERDAEIAFFPGGVTGSREDFFRELCKQFRIPSDSASLFDLTRSLKGFTAGKLDEERSVIVLVDEAQDLAVEELNHFRYLNNLETPDAKFLQIVLAGMPELDDKLRDPRLESLRQRIAIRCVIQPLEPQAAIEYVLHRLRVAGSASDDLFTLEALRRIVHHARGIPRRINVLCDNAMIIAFALKKPRVEEAFVLEALEGVDGERPEGDREGSVLSLEEVASLYGEATRRLGARAVPGDAAPSDPYRSAGALAGAAPSGPGRSRRDAVAARTVSVEHLEGVPEPPSGRRKAVLSALAAAALVLAVLLVYAVRGPDRAGEQAPGPEPVPARPGPEAPRPEAAVPAPDGAVPFAGFLTAGLRRERLEAGSDERARAEPSDATTDGLPAPDGPRAVPRPDARGLAALARTVYGTLTLRVLEDLAARNPGVTDWNRVESPAGLRLPEEAPPWAGGPVDFYSVQVASFRQEASIRRTAAKLCADGVLNVFVLGPDPAEQDEEDGRGWFRCSAGVFASWQGAESWRDRMRRAGFPDAYVIRVRGAALEEIHVPCLREGRKRGQDRP